MGEGMGEGRHYCKASCVRIEGASSTAHLSSLENVVDVFEPREVCEKSRPRSVLPSCMCMSVAAEGEDTCMGHERGIKARSRQQK